VPLRDFARCMHGHGLQMPDPQPWRGTRAGL
jgi:hypothetical protein